MSLGAAMSNLARQLTDSVAMLRQHDEREKEISALASLARTLMRLYVRNLSVPDMVEAQRCRRNAWFYFRMARERRDIADGMMVRRLRVVE